jgi:hypothetical protein
MFLYIDQSGNDLSSFNNNFCAVGCLSVTISSYLQGGSGISGKKYWFNNLLSGEFRDVLIINVA